MCKRAHLNGLMEYMRLGNLIKLGLINQFGKIRGGIVKYEVTEKGLGVLAQESDAAGKDIQGNRLLRHEDFRLLDLLGNCHTESLCQTPAIAQGNP